MRVTWLFYDLFKFQVHILHSLENISIFNIWKLWLVRCDVISSGTSLIQKVRIVFDCVTKPFTHCNAFCHVSLCELLLYLDLVRIQMEICFENMPQRLSRDPQFLTASSKRFLWTVFDWVPYCIDVSFCPRTHLPTGISVRDAFRIKILHCTMLSKLINPFKNSAFWWSISTQKLSPKICLHDRVWFVGKIGFHTECLLLGRPGHVGENYGSNLSCTESTSYPEKTKELELNLWISDKNIWVLFFLGHPVLPKMSEKFWSKEIPLWWVPDSTLKLNNSRTAWPIPAIYISFSSIVNALSYEINLFSHCSSPLKGTSGRKRS